MPKYIDWFYSYTDSPCSLRLYKACLSSQFWQNFPKRWYLKDWQPALTPSIIVKWFQSFNVNKICVNESNREMQISWYLLCSFDNTCDDGLNIILHNVLDYSAIPTAWQNVDYFWRAALLLSTLFTLSKLTYLHRLLFNSFDTLDIIIA